MELAKTGMAVFGENLLNQYCVKFCSKCLRQMLFRKGQDAHGHSFCKKCEVLPKPCLFCKIFPEKQEVAQPNVEKRPGLVENEGGEDRMLINRSFAGEADFKAKSGVKGEEEKKMMQDIVGEKGVSLPLTEVTKEILQEEKKEEEEKKKEPEIVNKVRLYSLISMVATCAPKSEYCDEPRDCA